MRIKYAIMSLTLILSLAGCYDDGVRDNFAPVSTAWYQPQNNSLYKVRKGETLYSVAWRYDMDYRNLAQYNRLKAPYTLHVGQVLRLKPSPSKRYSRPSRPKKTSYRIAKRSRPLPSKIKKSNTSPAWLWPAKGKIVKRYSVKSGSKGINIAGRLSTPVRATASGRVAYSGHGLKGYGNLLIIKHNNEFLSAYAHNKKNLVREGQRVKAGQIIAEMGNTQSKLVMLHFEIRKAGKPVNPLNYIKPG